MTEQDPSRTSSGGTLTPEELTAKIAEIESRLDRHDDALARIITALGSLIEPEQQTEEKKGEIGFHVRELGARYNFKRRES